MEKFKPENLSPLEGYEKEQEEKLEKLQEVLEVTREKLNFEKIPATDDCRIDMDAFEGIYSREEIARDEDIIKKWEGEWKEKELYKNIELLKEGNQLEVLKTFIFNKFAGDKLLAVRASRYDDIMGGVDNILINKNTGKTICAFDEVGDVKGDKYQEKKSKILEKNKRGGAGLKYGLKLNREKGEAELKRGPRERLPIFFLALPSEVIDESVKNLKPSFEEKSDYEKKIFDYFSNCIKEQTSFLNLSSETSKEILENLDANFLE